MAASRMRYALLVLLADGSGWEVLLFGVAPVLNQSYLSPSQKEEKGEKGTIQRPHPGQSGQPDER